MQSIGIDSAEMLCKMGAEEAFVRLKEKYPSICVVFLYTLEGANYGYGISQIARFSQARAENI
ncbi:MAG: TfoX/Sxy family protein [Helicobacter sp.]|uniref:TfoX/Sxy family DNA transformation protein n=1 Tax=uncultured Helicobacter sp. TaxID=175537 RepID=UPI0023BBAA64|nr:TfoX/Sxy family DNA transformation protein [uncultured Helicobacter sp.]MDE6979287.1 TfoX/Sxy family protein [Helicobacter sp.]